MTLTNVDDRTRSESGVRTHWLAAIRFLPLLIAACLLPLSACGDDSANGRGSSSTDTRSGGRTSAVQTAGAPLVVDDAASANPALVEVPVQSAGGVTLRVPSGFTVTRVAAGLRAPRFMAFDSAGNLLVADQGAGNVYRYTPSALATRATTAPAPLISGLTAPSNVALTRIDSVDYLYVGETNAVARYVYSTSGSVGAREIVIPGLPTGGHSTRTIAFGPDGMLYLAVGSSCNICSESDEQRAAVLRYNPDGTGYERFAWGLRNPVGLAFEPGTERLWATVNERDNQGNEIPPDLVTDVQRGANYGWPGCQPPAATPQESGTDCTGITPPAAGIQAHSAPLGLAFATGSAFPAQYQGGIFVVQHGSWNRQPPAAPKLLYVELRDGVPVAIRDFATGWQGADGKRWGRPAGVIVAPDGSVIVSDDQAGALYRISVGG